MTAIAQAERVENRAEQLPANTTAADEYPRPWKWTTEKYYLAAETGVFGPEERLELIEGEVLKKVSPQNEAHARAGLRADNSLREVFGREFHLRNQLPIQLANDSEPEPDLVVLRGSIDDWSRHPRPDEAVLLIEVSDSTLAFDMRRKAALYARAGVVEYWVVSLPERCLYVHRGPQATGQYAEVMKLAEGESIAPLGAPNSAVEVASLLPLAPAPASDTKE